MSNQVDITTTEGWNSPPAENPICDPLTRYPIQIWEQHTLIAHQRTFIVLYFRDGRWRKGSAAMLDRCLRRFGMPQLTNAPWGAGPELGLWADDLVGPMTHQECQDLVDAIDAEGGV